jgi:hypothetical protein
MPRPRRLPRHVPPGYRNGLRDMHHMVMVVVVMVEVVMVEVVMVEVLVEVMMITTIVTTTMIKMSAKP